VRKVKSACIEAPAQPPRAGARPAAALYWPVALTGIVVLAYTRLNMMSCFDRNKRARKSSQAPSRSR
jgi:hypothetical protein